MSQSFAELNLNLLNSKLNFMSHVKIYRIQILTESNPDDYDLLDCNAV
jgi:hypothetical protein